MVVALDSLQPTFILPPLDEIRDDQQDVPQSGRPLVLDHFSQWYILLIFFTRESWVL